MNFVNNLKVLQIRYKRNKSITVTVVRKAKYYDFKCKLTSQLIDENKPPGKWWRIAKSVTKFTKNIFIRLLHNSEILANYFVSTAIIDTESDIPDDNKILVRHH